MSKTKPTALEIGNTINIKTPVTLYKMGETTTVSIKPSYVLKLEKEYPQMLIFSIHFNKSHGDNSSAKNLDKVRIGRSRLERLGYEIINPEKP